MQQMKEQHNKRIGATNIFFSLNFFLFFLCFPSFSFFFLVWNAIVPLIRAKRTNDLVFFLCDQTFYHDAWVEI